jgi:hypothetical protein
MGVVALKYILLERKGRRNYLRYLPWGVFAAQNNQDYLLTGLPGVLIVGRNLKK